METIERAIVGPKIEIAVNRALGRQIPGDPALSPDAAHPGSDVDGQKLLGVTADPTAQWIAQQLTEACGWNQAARYLIRDRDRIYGEAFKRRLHAMNIRDHPTAPRSPWQNGQRNG